MAMPGGSIEDKEGTCGTARREVLDVSNEALGNLAGPHVLPPVRPGHEAGRSVVRAEHVDHQDEPEEGPIRRAAIHINVKALGRRAGPECPRVKGAELEGATNDEGAGLKKGRKDIDLVELWASVDEIVHPRRGGADPDVCSRRGVHRGGVGVAQALQGIGRHGAREHDEPPLL